MECVPYGYPKTLAFKYDFPTINEVAFLLGNDSDGQSLWSSLQSSIPQISPKGTSDGNFSQVVYNGVTDPDCWWSYTNCVTPKHAGLSPDIVTVPEVRFILL